MAGKIGIEPALDPLHLHDVYIEPSLDPDHLDALMEPIFAELTDRYSEQPVLFVTRDLTTPDSRQRWVEMTKALDIEWLSPLTRYSGQIQLADRDQREILAHAWLAAVICIGAPQGLFRLA